ncbi:MAG: hypothetical protein NWR72_03460 [Bacteroidia bacterium]|nr:hypothetical protein [Bacteroidia bacterium]
MIGALLFFTLGTALMLALGSMFGKVSHTWMLAKRPDNPALAEAWARLLLASYYLLFLGVLVMSLEPIPNPDFGTLMIGVALKLGPLLLILGGMMMMAFLLVIRKTASEKPSH